MTDLTPRPTEYKGIAFRSKSEAMFARYLELDIEHWEIELTRPSDAKIIGKTHGIIYEPRRLLVDDWVPDFLVWWVELEEESGLPELFFRLIEYKPSRPTGAYLNRFVGYCREINKRHVPNGGYGPIDYELFYGSVWAAERGIFSPGHDRPGDDGWVLRHREEDWLAEYEDAVKATRFDLAESLPTGVT